MDEFGDRAAALRRHHDHWALYWRDRNQRWHRYDLIEPSPDVLALLDEIDRDPTCIFWG